MWKFYNRLNENIPDQIKIDDFVIGSEFVIVITKYGAGISRLLYDKRFSFRNNIEENISLKKLAKCIKSWNFIEASLGLAAINAYYNQNLGDKSLTYKEIKHPFIGMIDENEDGKFAVVDGIINNKDKIKNTYDVDFFNRNMEDGDYSIVAYDYLSKNYDNTYLGGNLIINKHLIKVSEDSKGIENFVCDISTPLTLEFKNLGINKVGGFAITDVDKCYRRVKQGGTYEEIESTGKFVNIIEER